MPKFSKTSMDLLLNAHLDLRMICLDVIKSYDFTILETHRDMKRQEALKKAKKTKLGFPQSNHNSMPSRAIDIAPYPIDWNNRERFYLLAGFMFQAAHTSNIKLRWGGDWDRDWNFKDQSFDDLVHFELFGNS